MAHIDFDQVNALESTHVLQTYKRAPVAFVRGEGTRLFDSTGKRYLDFISGHRRRRARARRIRRSRSAIAEQAATLIQTSNLYFHPLQGQLAARLAALSGLQRSFFCNSGTEAVEACLKFARRYWLLEGREAAHAVTSRSQHGFSGRTMGALSVTANASYREPFEPLIPGVTFVVAGRSRGARCRGDRRDGGDHRRADSGRGRRAAAVARVRGGHRARLRDAPARCSSPTKCSAGSAAPASRSISRCSG